MRVMPVIVSFVSQKGGVGKSTLARALLAISSYDLRVRLADLDPQQGSVVAWEQARRRHPDAPPCEVVPYATAAEAVLAGGDVELLIIDMPARTNRATLEVARRSNLVVQPTGPSADDLRPAILTFHELVKEGIPKDRLAMAICRVLSDGEEATVRSYVQAAGYQVLAGAVPERIAYREAQNRGHAITETSVAALNTQADRLMEALLMKVTDAIELESERRKAMERKR